MTIGWLFARCPGIALARKPLARLKTKVFNLWAFWLRECPKLGAFATSHIVKSENYLIAYGKDCVDRYVADVGLAVLGREGYFEDSQNCCTKSEFCRFV